MNYAFFLALVLNLLAIMTTTAGEKPAPLQLFNGKTLDDWVAEGARDYPNPKDRGKRLPNWTATDGKIICAGKGYGFLRYAKKEFTDFHFHVEYRMVDPKSKRNNSGIGIRTPAYDPKRSRATRPSIACYEIQLLNDAGQKPTNHGTGSLYRHIAPKVNAVKPAPAWNVMDIICTGPRIRIMMNDKEIIDFDQSTRNNLKNKPRKGYVCLQSHGSRIEFRNVWLREIKGKTP